MYHYYKKQPPAPPVEFGIDDAFEVLNRISPVVVLIRDERQHIHAIEHVHGGKLMRQLDQFGREGVRIIGLFSGDGVADRSSLRALNVYLRHGPGLDAFRRSPGLHCCRHPFHRLGWPQLVKLVGLRFVRP